MNQTATLKIHPERKGSFIETVNAILPEGGNLNLCLTCGACASGCPATGLEGMDPRKFLRMAALGLDEEITMKSDAFEPQILAYCCKYCAYAAADLAGSMRLEYPPNVKVVQLPCSGRVDMLHLLKAIEKGADGVYVAGCLEGECHFVEGNLKTRKKVDIVKNALEAAGVEPERVEMFNLSSAMGPRFAEIAEEITERIRMLGPTPVIRKLTAA